MFSENVPSSKNFYINQKFKFNLLSPLNILNSSNYLIINKYQNYLKSQIQEGYLVFCTSNKKPRKQLKFNIYLKIKRVVERAIFRFNILFYPKLSTFMRGSLMIEIISFKKIDNFIFNKQENI